MYNDEKFNILNVEGVNHSSIAKIFGLYYDDVVYSKGNWYQFDQFGKYILMDEDEFTISWIAHVS